MTEENAATEDDSTEVVVEVNPEDTPVIVDEGDTTVIVEPPADDNAGADALDAVEVATAIDHEGRIAQLEVELAAANDRAVIAEAKAESAQYSVDNLADELSDETEQINDNFEEIADADVVDIDNDGTEELDADIVPVSAKRHWMFQSFSELTGRK